MPELKAHAKAVGLDQAAFDQCLDSGKHAAIVQEDVELGAEMGVQSTPTLYINGRVVTGAQPLGGLRSHHRRRAGPRAEVGRLFRAA